MAERDRTVLTGNFDLQHVIYLLISNEDALFYKRRQSNYILTFYNFANHSCICYSWHEGQSKRGSSEISTALYLTLKSYEKNMEHKVHFFLSDGYLEHNKNTAPSGMMSGMNFSTRMQEMYFGSLNLFMDSMREILSTAQSTLQLSVLEIYPCRHSFLLSLPWLTVKGHIR